MSIKDFDKLYEKYVKSWAVKNADKLKKSKSIEDFIEDIYQGFITTKCDQLGGLTPNDYFDSYSSDELVDFLKQYIDSGISVPAILMDKISSSTDSRDKLLAMIGSESNEFVMTAINLVNEMPGDFSEQLSESLIELLLSEKQSDEIRELVTEILTANCENVKDKLIDKIDNTKLNKTNEYLADILVNARGEEKVYNLLCKLFLSGKNDSLYAAYLGKYGDDKALSLLYDKLNSVDINYVEFLEVRNSIERLGGEITKTFDFSEDPYFKALRNIN